jgi:hypothetical protein
MLLSIVLTITACVCLPINTGFERISKNIVTEAAKNAIQESKILHKSSENNLNLLAQVSSAIQSGSMAKELVSKDRATENIPKNSMKRSFDELQSVPVSLDSSHRRGKFYLKSRKASPPDRQLDNHAILSPIKPVKSSHLTSPVKATSRTKELISSAKEDAHSSSSGDDLVDLFYSDKWDDIFAGLPSFATSGVKSRQASFIRNR